MLTCCETSKPVSLWFLWFTIQIPTAQSWFDTLSKTKEWLQKQEELCLQGEKNRQTQHEMGF